MTATRVVALSGGVGGAKLALGLAHEAPGQDLLVVANTGDDFTHLGLAISPDIDSVVYALSGLNDQQRGWGRKDETWTFMSALGDLGGETWFNLGDGDLATHVRRTEALSAGASLSDITAEIATALGISARILPMSDDRVATVVETASGPLAFQHYFVREQCAPAVTGFRFDGIDDARPHPGLMTALADPALEAVIITPSNPFVSIDPILALPGVREAISGCAVPVIAVSPIIGGAAIKGPAAKMFRDLGFAASALGVARHYAGLIDGFIFDTVDAEAEAEIRALGVATLVADTVMRTLEDRRRLAGEALAFATGLRRGG